MERRPERLVSPRQGVSRKGRGMGYLECFLRQCAVFCKELFLTLFGWDLEEGDAADGLGRHCDMSFDCDISKKIITGGRRSNCV